MKNKSWWNRLILICIGLIITNSGLNIVKGDFVERQNSQSDIIPLRNINSNYNGNTLYVGGSGPGNFTKIQDAIDNASNGKTVFV